MPWRYQRIQHNSRHCPTLGVDKSQCLKVYLKLEQWPQIPKEVREAQRSWEVKKRLQSRQGRPSYWSHIKLGKSFQETRLPHQYLFRCQSSSRVGRRYHSSWRYWSNIPKRIRWQTHRKFGSVLLWPNQEEQASDFCLSIQEKIH